MTPAPEPESVDNPYDAELSALVDTWQRRFNLELQRALDAESRIDALEAVLAFYAEEGNYFPADLDRDGTQFNPIEHDEGNRARAVLAGEGNE